MTYFHGTGRKNRYFEGWYFKHRMDDISIALIPGYSISKDGSRAAFIQVITPELSYNFEFPYEQFHASKEKLDIRIADNRFTEYGIMINLSSEALTIKGELRYGEFRRLKNDVMGPFRFMPFMQCRHGVISMYHSLRGAIFIRDRYYSFDGGVGYIETDRGSSFPKNYFWTQFSTMEDEPCSVMVSVADIPFAGLRFRGCIGCVCYGDDEYRLATYNGVKIERYHETGVVLKQGRNRLEIETNPLTAQTLFAPNQGLMNKEIRESVSCQARARFFVSDRLVFDIESRYAGFEFVK